MVKVEWEAEGKVIDINFLIIAYRQAAYMQAVKAGLNFEEYYDKDRKENVRLEFFSIPRP